MEPQLPWTRLTEPSSQSNGPSNHHHIPLTPPHCLCSNRVTRDGMRHLAEVLKQNPTLEILDLTANRMEDDGAVYLGEAIAWPGCALRE